MKAIILTAGFGRRMRPLTDQCHKTLLQIGEKTIIERILDGLVSNDVTEIVIVTGYRDQDVISFVTKRYPSINVQFVHNPRYAETNNIYSLALAFNQIKIDDDILVIESDLIYDPSVIERIIQSTYSNAALVDRFRSGMDGTVVTVENGVITSVIPPHLQGPKFDFTDKFKTLNIYRFSKEFCESSFNRLLSYYANVIDENCYYELILGILIYMQHDVVHAEILEDERWAEVDDPNDLSVADFTFNDKTRKSILDQSYGGFWNYNVLDFCYIRNMYFPTDAMISEMRNALPDVIHNYGSSQVILNRKAAYWVMCNEEHINVLNGASQIYPILREKFGSKRVLCPWPTFGEYQRVFHSTTFYKDCVGIDRIEIEQLAKGQDVIVIVNPNNPTGSWIESEWIIDFARNSPKTWIIVDESFIEFSNCQSVVSLLRNEPVDNVLVVKSLSKSLGIPGIRLGYSFSVNSELNSFIRDRIPIWNLNSLAEYTLELLLKYRAAFDASIEWTRRDRDHFAESLHTVPLVKQVFPSAGNFLLTSLHYQGREQCDVTDTLLREYGIYVHDASKKFSDDVSYFRLAVRLPEENQKLIHALRGLTDQR